MSGDFQREYHGMREPLKIWGAAARGALTSRGKYVGKDLQFFIYTTHDYFLFQVVYTL